MASTAVDDDTTAALQRIDPFLRFLTKATGKVAVPLKSLESVLPKKNNIEENADNDSRLRLLLTELSIRGVLKYNINDETVGFPLPPSPVENDTSSSSQISVFQPPSKMIGKGLHGSSDAAAKRRMRVLKWTLKQNNAWVSRQPQELNTEEKGIETDSTPQLMAAATETKEPSKPAAKEIAKKRHNNNNNNNRMHRFQHRRWKLRRTQTSLSISCRFTHRQ